MPTRQSVCQIPCALRNHLRVDPLTNLSQPEREILFQRWVVTEREVLPSLSLTERLTCPLLWCGINFVDHESFFRHLKDCPQLSASSYWCPRCHRAESFASNKIPESIPEPIPESISEPIPEPIRGSDNQRPVQKKPSRLTKLLRKTFKRKRATDLRQDLTMKPQFYPQELHSNPICEMDGQDDGELVGNDPKWHSSEMGVDVEQFGKQSDIYNTHNINSTSIEKESRDGIFEKDGYNIPCGVLLDGGSSTFSDRGDELPVQPNESIESEVIDFGANGSGQSDPRSHIGGSVIDNTSTGSNQSNRPSHPLNPVPDRIVPDHRALSNHFIYTVSGSYHNHDPCCYPTDSVYFPKPACQDHISSQINGRNSALETFGDQLPWSPHSYDHTLSSVRACYDSLYAQNQDPAPFADGQSLWSPAKPDRTPRSVPLDYNSPYAKNQTPALFPEGQSHWSPARSDRTPKSVRPGFGSPFARNWLRMCMNPINTTNFSAEYNAQTVRHHPNPETVPQNSPLSAGSSQTNTTSSGESTETAPTPVTPFSASGSPVAVSPRNMPNSSASRSGRYPCQECIKTFTDPSNLKRHIKDHRRVIFIECRARCGKKIKNRKWNEERHYFRELIKEQDKVDTNLRLIHLNFRDQGLSETP